MSLRLSCSRASSRFWHISWDSVTRFRRSERSSAMTFSSMATFCVCAFSSAWCSRFTFASADLVSRTTASSRTFVSVTSCSSRCVFWSPCFVVSSCTCRFWTCSWNARFSCCRLFLSSDSCCTWTSRCLTSSRRFWASTSSCRNLSTSSRCWPWTLSSVDSDRSSISALRRSSISWVLCSRLRSLYDFWSCRRSSTISLSSLPRRSTFSRRPSRSAWTSRRRCISSSHWRSIFRTSR
mmetsp:Transcript_79340/g.224407  ORF Transcript_79340/g.224407 Transcript_79340/m.224407 type:complete len:237 (-) Transcript_79340:224-934(-)